MVLAEMTAAERVADTDLPRAIMQLGDFPRTYYALTYIDRYIQYMPAAARCSLAVVAAASARD